MNATTLVAQLSGLPTSMAMSWEAGDREATAVAIYVLLTGCEPAAARIDDDHAFDTHVLASLLAVAASEDGAICERIGLAADDLAAMIVQWFPQAQYVLAAWASPDNFATDDEVAMVRDLLLAHRTRDSEDSRRLAAMIARRAMESNHLWEDLGLRDRAELSRLLTRHFAPIANRNTRNMRWKRFFYRMMCERDGFTMCSTPVCTNCRDFDLCFGEESGESRLANARRALALEEAAL